MPNEPLTTKERKEVTLTKEGALLLIEIINDMRHTPIWRYPAQAALRNNDQPNEYRKYETYSGSQKHPDSIFTGYTFPHRFFPQHQLVFTAMWAAELKDKITPVATHDHDNSQRESRDANFITGLLVLLSQIHKGKAPLPSLIWQED